ncbi:hypothetical protein HK100_011372 [Physocladia obscura]|uniref:N-acetylgalactosaminide beta-1,3-galactosyltransferase n=1 Tax=Physocladia obscura TaxID=109957 RepID=A0AAD5T1Y4_9FUNG|nr:hypothetical protein HK100_011372 [Physocladia obscura]
MNPQHKEQEEESRFLPGKLPPEKYALILKTGQATLDRAQVQLATVLANHPTLLVISDIDAVLGDVQIHNVLSSSTPQNLADASHLANRDRAHTGDNDASTQEFDVLDTQWGEGWNNDARKFFPGLRLAHDKFPNVDWYVLIDDDAFVFLDNLSDYLGVIDPNNALYFGLVSEVLPSPAACGATEERNQFIYGGSGIVISKIAMAMLMEVIDLCIADPALWNCWAGDVALGMCMYKANISLLQGVGFHSMPVTSPDYQFVQPACEPPKIVHKLNTKQMEKLFNHVMQQPHKTITTGDVYRLFHDIKNDEPFEVFHNDTNFHGLEYWTGAKKSEEECHKTCLDDKNCVTWIFFPFAFQCYLKGTVDPLGIASPGTGYKAGI